MNRVHKYDRIHALQRAVLPLLNERHLIRYIRNHGGRDVDPVQMIQVILNVACAYTLRVHRDNLILNAGNGRLVLLHDNGFKLAVSVAWNVNLHIAIFARDRLESSSQTSLSLILKYGLRVYTEYFTDSAER